MSELFDGLDKTDENPAPENAETSVEAEESDDDGLFLDLELDDEDFLAAPSVPREKRDYIVPANDAFVPVRVTKAEMLVQDMRCVLVDENGEASIHEGVSAPHFAMEFAPHAPIYGDRYLDFRYWTPVKDVYRIKAGTEDTSKKFLTQGGRKLLSATRAIPPGRHAKVDMAKVCANMLDKVILIQAKREIGKRTKMRDVLDSNKNKIYVLAGTEVYPAKFAKNDEGVFYDTATDEPYEGPTDGFFQFNGDYYLRGEKAPDFVVLTESYEQEFVRDKPGYDTYPIPHRMVPKDKLDQVVPEDVRDRFTIHPAPSGEAFAVERLVVARRTDNKRCAAQVTWDTIGLMASKEVKPGTMIQAVTHEGELMTLSLMGQEWIETDVPHVIDIDKESGVISFNAVKEEDEDGLGEFSGL